MSRQKSENIRLDTRSSGIKDIKDIDLQSIRSKKSILVLESHPLKKKDTEFDWKDRLKQWN